MINLELSQQLSKAVRARAKECFNNAYRGIQDHYPDGLYLEGWVVTNHSLMPVEHAWLEVNGEIIDPTFCKRRLPLRNNPGAGTHSSPTWVEAYFPVLRLTRLQVDKFLRMTGQTHFMFYWFDEDIFTDEQRQQYKAARQQAEEFLERRERTIE